jgi:hypothetical protein
MSKEGERTRNANRRRVVAASVASFLALLGYEAARLYEGGDPALAGSNAKAAATKSSQSTTSSSSEQSTTSTQEGGSSGYYDDGQGYGGDQGYYTPPTSDAPSTGSS